MFYLHPLEPDLHYIHRLHPEIISITEQLALRWYGLAYLAGVLAAYGLLLHLARKNLFHLAKPQIQDFLATLFLLGVFVGGRLGYFLFYTPEVLWTDPFQLLRVWEGGMASHGGILGCALVMVWGARRYRVPFWHLADNMVAVGPLGLFFGRIANFINGELWGRPSTVPWAVVFPDEIDYPSRALRYHLPHLRRLVDDGILVPRHPSQLYEALGEGLLLFLLLFALRHSAWSRAKEGRLSIVFLLGYALARFVCEFFREPDSTIYFGWMSKGQLLTLGMIAAALLIRRIPRSPMRSPTSQGCAPLPCKKA